MTEAIKKIRAVKERSTVKFYTLFQNYRLQLLHAGAAATESKLISNKQMSIFQQTQRLNDNVDAWV